MHALIVPAACLCVLGLYEKHRQDQATALNPREIGTCNQSLRTQNTDKIAMRGEGGSKVALAENGLG